MSKKTAVLKEPVELNDDVELVESVAGEMVALTGQITQACKRVPPLWPLKNFVAVNPFMGLADQSFATACSTMRRVAHADILSPLSFYRQHLESLRIIDADLQTAIDESRELLIASLGEPVAHTFTIAYLKDAVRSAAPEGRNRLPEDAMLSVSEVFDSVRDTNWSRFIVEECSKWCGAYYDQGQSAWRMPWRSLPPYAGWKQAAVLDQTPEIMGLPGFRDKIAELPAEPLQAIETVLNRLEVPANKVEEFLHHELMTLSGWSAYVQYLAREKGLYGTEDDSLVQLLAIRLAYDYALYALHPDPQFRDAWQTKVVARSKKPIGARDNAVTLDLMTRYVLQQAFERGFQRDLVNRLAISNQLTIPGRKDEPRKAVQAAFCIDVRSEVYRRNLEVVSPAIETIGFAGFFAFFIEYIQIGHQHGSAQCPVLFTPKFRVRETVKNASAEEVDDILSKRIRRKLVDKAWRSFKTSAVSCFPFVETTGLMYGAKLITDTFGITRTVVKPSVDGFDQAVAKRTAPKIEFEKRSLGMGADPTETGIVTTAQVDAAATALGAMALTSNFARLVALCGHGSTTVNNPYASGLDCGACGGHTGEANVRVGAAIFNHPDIRAGLAERGIVIPDDTWFIGVLHDTCTDDLRIYDEDLIPASHQKDVEQLRIWLEKASHATRKERSDSLGISTKTPGIMDEQVRVRSRDWAQVRPEWALANNAAFIAAPRERTKNLNLGGRSFLHNYHSEADPEKAVLELIMIAPMVVANWINMQYYGSTVNNERFGSGNKVLHNVIGTVGVLQGNGGDLQVGLPIQSVHDGQQAMHEPLRLNVFIEASQEEMNRIIEKHENVRQLLDNQWLHLFQIAEEGKRYFRYNGNLSWQAVN
ncbi:MAG: DUF2309 domain-containing protein [Candidatus Competibacteraceae bacterium]|nr:DUF2309 domain-containing protein [Candidatus Competibacteraceae bacterium]